MITYDRLQGTSNLKRQNSNNNKKCNVHKSTAKWVDNYGSQEEIVMEGYPGGHKLSLGQLQETTK